MHRVQTLLLMSLLGACAVADAGEVNGAEAATDVGNTTATPPVGQAVEPAAGQPGAGQPVAGQVVGTACGQSDAAEGWFTGAFAPPAGDHLTVELYAKVHEPNYQRVDTVVGLGHGPVADFTDLATIVRFNPDGYVDARNGSAYQAASAFRFDYDHLYAVRFVVDLATHHYDAYIRTYDTPAPGDLIASHYAFRTEQRATSQLDSLGHEVDSATGSLYACVQTVGP